MTDEKQPMVGDGEIAKSIYPETAADALARWDAGYPVFTIEMGGLGPGYEQAIHIGVFELIRALQGHEEALATANEVGHRRLGEVLDEYLLPISKVKSLGLSGAQAGAIKSLAYATITRGWRTCF